MNLSIIFAEDQSLIRESLALLLNDGEDLHIVATASNGKDALDLCLLHRPDLALLDIKMPVMNGLEAARRIKESLPACKVVLLTTFPDAAMLQEALTIGVNGFLLKEAEPALFLQAIRSIAAGLVVFQESLLPQMQNVQLQKKAPPLAELGLSPKDLDFIRHIVNGLGNKEIAFEEHCSEGTVKNRISSILTKLNLEARTQIAVFAIKNGLIKDLD